MLCSSSKPCSLFGPAGRSGSCLGLYVEALAFFVVCYIHWIRRLGIACGFGCFPLQSVMHPSCVVGVVFIFIYHII